MVRSNHEAAGAVLHNALWFISADERIALARKVVRAALGDCVLYEIVPDKEVDVDSFAAVDLHTGGLRCLVQVYPEAME